MEDITVDQKYNINIGIQNLLDLSLESFDSTLLIFNEFIKCTFVRDFLYLELSSSQYDKFSVSDINKVKTEDFLGRIDYIKNLILCLKIKENLSSVIKLCNLYDRYLIFCLNNEKYYNMISEERDLKKNFRYIEPTKKHLKIVI